MTRSYCAPSALTETAIATVIQYSISKPNSDDRDADRISVDYGFSVGQKTRLRYFPLGQWSMSALGQKQTCATHKPMSAKCQGSEADMCRFAPKADIHERNSVSSQ
jgi:hypothetical protein